MKRFQERHRAHVQGALSGPDRVLFHGSLRSLVYPDGLGRFLSMQHILFKDFAAFAQPFSDRLKADAETLASSLGRPSLYVASPSRSKEQLARSILAEHPISEGLIALLRCVEPCRAVSFRTNQKRQREPVFLERRCTHLYFYLLDPELGFCHVRLQTWFPFDIQICVNGREWLARQLDGEGIGYQKVDNCFTHIDDLERAQELMDQLEALAWGPVLDRLARQATWLVREGELFGRDGYFWTVRQSEVATDILFESPASLAAIYPHLVRYSIEEMKSLDVLGYLGRQTNSRFGGKLEKSLKGRAEGVRVKHWVEENSIKMYDKAGSVLRVETTINNPERLRVWRAPEGSADGVRKRMPMRKGLGDWAARQQASRAANARYLDALSVVGEQRPSAEILDEVSGRVVVEGRPYRGIRPIDAAEAKAFAVLLDGKYAVEGVTNRELREALFGEASTPEKGRTSAARVTRLLRIYRAHGVLTKLAGRSRYRVTHKGQEVMATALRIRRCDIALLAA